jgi:hypothetical protein
MSHYTNGLRAPQVPRGDSALSEPEGAVEPGGRSDRSLATGPWTGGRVRALVRALTLTGLIGLCAMALPVMAAAATGISGKVTEAEAPHDGINGADVCLYSESFTLIKCEVGVTEPSGEYKIEGLTEGDYRVGFNATGFASQYWDGVSSLYESTVVTVTSGVVTKNIDAALEVAGEGSITGQVTSASNGQGAGGIEACIYTPVSHCVETNGNGEYSLSGLPVGSYTIYFSAAQACEEEQGEKVRCQPKSNYIAQSASVKVKASKTTTENVALQVGGQVSGTVTNASITHPGLAKLAVCADKVDSSGESSGGGGCGYTNGSGQYTISGLEGGSYKVSFSGYICMVVKKGSPWECPETYVTEYYQGQPTFQKAKTISVTTGSNTGGIDESLHESFPTTPASTAAPTLSGTPVAGDALTCSQGSWSHEPTYLVYQWLRDSTPISGQSGTTYTLQTADQGHSITCAVWAGNGAGIASASSGAVKVAKPLAVSIGVVVKGNAALLKLRCTGGGGCSGTLKLVLRVRRGKHGAIKVAIGQARFSIAAGKSATVRIPLTSQGRSLLRRAGRRGLKVTVTGTGVKGAIVGLKPAGARKHKKK